MNDSYRVTYHVESTDIPKAAEAIVIGQSVGNPNIRSSYETAAGIIQSIAELISIDGNKVVIDFKWRNLHSLKDIGQMLCTINGGQSDIGLINVCRIVDIELNQPFTKKTPTKKLNETRNRPLIGSIVKPKAGLNDEQLVDIVTQMCNGGIDFIKEDEILADPAYLPLERRLELIQPIMEQHPDTVYTYCVNGNPAHLIEQLDLVKAYRGDGVHINFWSGLGAYADSNERGLFTHFQRSGIRAYTDPRNPFGIDWSVIVKLAIYQGIDSIHAGMIGGYYPGDHQEVRDAVALCQEHNVWAALSCGMTPDIAKTIRDEIGNNWLANVGGWLHSGDDVESQIKTFIRELAA
jgi:ribulose 1,5-bisphosphate carboxylase large subunit-like protein